MREQEPPTSSGERETDGNGRRVPRERPLRLALYSHDTMGIGHMRRNVLIARTIASSPLPVSILLIAGAREVCAFELPPETDCLTLPSYHKEAGDYQTRNLGVSVDELTSLRSKTIAAALESFAPHVLIVDKLPRGARRELEPVLDLLLARGRTRCILGLRDVLDDPDTVRREWGDGAQADAVCDYFDAVWIYGDPAVYDQVREYEYPAAVAAKVCYTGYVTRPLRTHFSEIDGLDVLPLIASPTERLFLCMVGGGQDGAQLAEAFAQVPFAIGTKGVILTGPHMPSEVRQRLCRLKAANPRLCVLKFVTDPDLLLSLADRVVTMGGYNTICEVLTFQKRALIVPRIKPRREQFIRAQRLQQLGLIDMLHPDDVNPDALAEWLGRDKQPPTRVHERIDFEGAAKLPLLLEGLVAGLNCPTRMLSAEGRIQYAAP